MLFSVLVVRKYKEGDQRPRNNRSTRRRLGPRYIAASSWDIWNGHNLCDKPEVGGALVDRAVLLGASHGNKLYEKVRPVW